MRIRRVRGPRTSGSPPASPAVNLPLRAGPGDAVGGYRLVRLIGEGAAAAVFLGVPQDRRPEDAAQGDRSAEDAAQGDRGDDRERAVAIKLYRPETAPERIDREVRALTRVEHPHCLQLLDVGMDAEGRPCLVLERTWSGALGRLLVDGTPIAAGEAVTILAPLAGALDALHRAGVTHGGVRASAVHFREDGAPVLAGFGRASVTDMPGTGPGARAPLVADRVALLALVRAVLALAPSAGAERAAAALDALDPVQPQFAEQLETALFDLAEPQPVLVTRLHRGTAGQIPSRAVPTSASTRAVDAGAAAAAAAATAPRPSGRGGNHRATLPSSSSSWRSRLLSTRPRFWVMAGGVAVSLGAAVMVANDPVTPGAPSAGTGVPPVEVPATAISPGADDAALLRGDDPVAALDVLLGLRDRCVRELSVLCLDSVAQVGSAAYASDVAVVRALQSGGEVTGEAAIAVGELALVERLGDSALVALGGPADSKPASALVMKGEAGWRIRNYVP